MTPAKRVIEEKSSKAEQRVARNHNVNMQRKHSRRTTGKQHISKLPFSVKVASAYSHL